MVSLFIIMYSDIERHQARVINLEYVGEGPIQKTYMFVGKVSVILMIIHIYVVFAVFCFCPKE